MYAGDAPSLDFADEAIARYQTFKRSSPFAMHCEEFSLMAAVGDCLQGQAVLDLGCGWGCYTRRLAERRPASLVATDQSANAVALARAHNRDFHFVDYRVEDCANLADVCRFDLIVANFLLPFNANVALLRRTCVRVFAALKPGGRALGFVPNCEPGVNFSREAVGQQVNGMYEVPAEPADGDEMHLVLFTEPQETRIPLRWFHRTTYQTALLDAGFAPGQVRFDGPGVSEAGRSQYGTGFWDSIVGPPPTALLFQATK